MLNRKDYLLRQIQQLIDAIIMKFTSIELNEELYDPEEIADLYRKYFQENRDFFVNKSTAEIIEFLYKNTSPENALAKMEILAELLYGEGKILLRKDLEGFQNLPGLSRERSQNLPGLSMIQKAIELLEYNLQQSGVFDMQKMKRLREMKENL